MPLTQKVWKKGMTKLKQRGKAAKNIVITTAETKIEICYK